jgi:hypothetical protein
MKKLITFCAIILILIAANANANTVACGTAGSGASITVGVSDVMLHTDDGGVGSAYVRLTIDGGIALNAITSLSYDAKLTAFTNTDWPTRLEVVLNIDADNDGTLEGTGLAWMTPAASHLPSALGDDNFLSGDGPKVTSVDTDYATWDALGIESGYRYWSANETKDGFGSYYSNFSTVLGTNLPEAGIDVTDKVYSIDFICGTSSNWLNTDVYVHSVELNGTTYAVPGPTCMFVLAGDLDGDCKVDFADLKILCEQWLQLPGLPSADIWPSGGDDIINFEDFAVMAENWLIDCHANPSNPACMPK